MDLDTLHPLMAQHLRGSVVVADPADVVIPGSGPYDIEDGHHWNALRVHRLTDVVVDPSSGLVFAGPSVIAQSSYGFRAADDGAFLSSAVARARRARGTAPVTGPIAPFGGAVYNYYHFLIETIPRILHILSVEPSARVTLTEPLTAHIRKILDTLGIDYTTVPADAFPHDDVLLCDPAPFAWPHPANVRSLHDLPVGMAAERQYPTRLHISRTGSVRALAEEHLLDEYLGGLGYVSLRLETLPWEEQVAHFRAADSIVAAHGAGLANTVFMRPGTRVVELTSGTWWFPCFRNIAYLADVHHDLVQVEYEPQHPHGTALASVEALKSLDL
jgi:capsular polysaccharide biosynthesis protein